MYEYPSDLSGDELEALSGKELLVCVAACIFWLVWILAIVAIGVAIIVAFARSIA